MSDTDPRDAAATTLDPDDTSAEPGGSGAKLKKKAYEEQLARLQLELVKMEDWVKAKAFESSSCSKAAMPQERVALSSGSWMASTHGSAASSRSRPRRIARRASGISSATVTAKPPPVQVHGAKSRCAQPTMRVSQLPTRRDDPHTCAP